MACLLEAEMEPQMNTDRVARMPKLAIFSLSVFVGCLPAEAGDVLGVVRIMAAACCPMRGEVE